MTGEPNPENSANDRPATSASTGNDGASTPDWWEDHDLAVAVSEVEEFAAAAGWDQPPQLFALVRTEDLRASEPALAASLADAAVYTPIAQDALPAGELSEALAHIAWPAEVAGCVLVQEILVLPPEVGSELPDDPVQAAEQAADHPDRTEARLVAGVLRVGTGGACLLRVRTNDDPTPLRGADLAPNLLTALRMTFED